MTEPKPTAPKATEPKAGAPPWGKPEGFDSGRAWSLIRNLRAEVDELKTAKRSVDDVEAAREAAETRAADAERTLYVERALRRHEIPEDLADFVDGETEEEIEQRAETLAARLGSGEPVEEPTEDLGRSRLSPALSPGHGAEPEPTFDPAAVARRARGR